MVRAKGTGAVLHVLVGLRAAAAGLVTFVVLAGTVALCLTMFRGGFADTVPVTVLSSRAGLVMDP